MDIAIIGAGVSGLMAAGEACKNHKVTVFERNDKPGKKIYITGKGRCNITNDCTVEQVLNNVVTNPKFLMSAFNQFSPTDTINFFESLGLRLKTERGGRVFPLSDKASDVTKALLKNINNQNTVFKYENVVTVYKNEDKFVVKTDRICYTFDKVIFCCGGVSYPSTGSNGDAFSIVKSLGHTVTPLYPALVRMILQEDVKALQGLTLKNVNVFLSGESDRQMFGEMLFTDDGVSGPVILSLSSYINKLDLSKIKLHIDLKPALDEKTLDKRIIADLNEFKNKNIINALVNLLPRSIIPYIVSYSNISGDKQANAITKEERLRLVDALKNLTFSIKDLGSIATGIITSGGVSVKEINPRTMQSKLTDGLYFAGEMIDVDALTGGYNIQTALSTGFVAGQLG